MNKHNPFSYCIGVYNEEKVIVSAIAKINKNLSQILGKDNYEILIVDNGSKDKTLEILRNIDDKNLKVISLPEKAHGLALKTAIEKAKFENIALTGIDLPFGFKDLKQALLDWNSFDLIFGSKAHPDSLINADFKRKLTSSVFRFLLINLFKLRIADTQGSVFLKRNKIKTFLSLCNAKNGFFTAEIAILSSRNGLKMKEIPVFSKNYKKRKSKYRIFKDGGWMFLTMLRDYFYFKTKSFS